VRRLNGVWLFWLPFAYLAVAALISTAVRLQPRLTMAWSPQDFDGIVARSGGIQATQIGIVVDITFILLFAAIAPPVVRRTRAGHWWIIARAAAALDLAEDILVLGILSGETTSVATKALWFLCALKLAAYVAVIARMLISRTRTAALRRWLRRSRARHKSARHKSA
jgi:hypothetical protein